MILDNTLVLSDEQAITATALSTNVIDLGAAGTPYGASTALSADMGIGQRIALNVGVTAAFNNLTSLKISLETDDNAGMTSAKEVASRTYLLAEINSAKQLEFPAALIEGVDERYVALRYTVTGTAPTTGKITAAVVAAKQQQ